MVISGSFKSAAISSRIVTTVVVVVVVFFARWGRLFHFRVEKIRITNSNARVGFEIDIVRSGNLDKILLDHELTGRLFAHLQHESSVYFSVLIGSTHGHIVVAVLVLELVGDLSQLAHFGLDSGRNPNYGGYGFLKARVDLSLQNWGKKKLNKLNFYSNFLKRIDENQKTLPGRFDDSESSQKKIAVHLDNLHSLDQIVSIKVTKSIRWHILLFNFSNLLFKMRKIDSLTLW